MIDSLHLTRKLWRPHHQTQASALSEVSVEDHRERLALIKSLPDRTPKLLGAGIPSCFPDPSLLSLPSLPFSSSRHPTTRLSSEAQDTAAKSSPPCLYRRPPPRAPAS